MKSSRLIVGAIASSIAVGSAHAVATPDLDTSTPAAKPAISAAARQQIRDKIARFMPGLHFAPRLNIGETNFSEAHPHFSQAQPGGGPVPQPEYTQFSAQAPVPKGQLHPLHHRRGDLRAPATTQRPDVMLAFRAQSTDRG